MQPGRAALRALTTSQRRGDREAVACICISNHVSFQPCHEKPAWSALVYSLAPLFQGLMHGYCSHRLLTMCRDLYLVCRVAAHRDHRLSATHIEVDPTALIVPSLAPHPTSALQRVVVQRAAGLWTNVLVNAY